MSSHAMKDYTYYKKGIWIEKKQRAYQAWANYLLAPTCAVNSASLNSKRLFAKVRGCVAKVYHKDKLVEAAMIKVEASISQRRIRLLTDGGILVNPRMKKKAMKILLGYDTFWLKLGLETVFRMTISPKHKGTNLVADVEEDELQLKSQLTAFIDEQFFSAPNLKKKMRKNVKKQAAIMEELAAVVLKRFLLLVLLLDRTLTNAELPEALPLLFDTSSKIKSSADMIRTFLRGSLFGEGDTVKHLEHMGYVLRYEQGVVNEFDYRVADMSNDFKDGIRSCRLAEVLLGYTLMHRVNFNTTSNAVKVYNVKLALTSFSGQNKAIMQLKNYLVKPQDIVDGHGETTVGYLWNAALIFQIPQLLTVNALVYEIIQVKVHARATMTSAETSKICFPTGYDIRLALLLTWVQTVVSQYGASAKNYRSSFADGSVLCFLICHYLPGYMSRDQVYIAEIDEKLKEEIARQTSSPDSDSDDEVDSDDDDINLGQFGVYTGKGWMHQETFRRHRTGILQNFNAVFSVMRALGGIPETISALDFEEQGPDETAVVLYVSYMCARLLQVSREERAALTIQRTWKVYRGYADPIELIQLQEAEKQTKPRRRPREQRYSQDSSLTAFEYHRQRYSASRASSSSCGEPFSCFDATYVFTIDLTPKELEKVVKLQARVKGVNARRRFIRIKKAVRTLEDNFPFIRDRCGYLRVREQAREIRSAAEARAAAAKKREMTTKKAAATVIQSQWRRHRAEKRYREMKDAVEAFQSKMQSLKEEQAMVKAENAATSIQSSWRANRERQTFLQKQDAAVKIQSTFRGYQKRQILREAVAAAVVIQSVTRMHQAREEFLMAQSAAICLQQYIRRWLYQRRFDGAQKAVVLIQATYRMHLHRERFLETRQSTIVIQAIVRMHQAREYFLEVRNAVLCIQSYWRSYAARESMFQYNAAVILIQSTYRMHLAREHYLEVQQGIISIQAAVRMHQARECFLHARNAAIVIQSFWRGHVSRESLHKAQSAATLIQSIVRMHQVREEFLEKKAAAVCIQKCYRQHLSHADDRRQEAATTIQAVWKRYTQRQQYIATCHSTVIIQRAVRLYQKRKWLDDVETKLSSILVDFIAVLEQTHDVVKATVIIQAYARGMLARRNNQQTPSEIKETAKQKLAVKKMVMAYRGYRMRKEEAGLKAAKETLRTWLPTIKERCSFQKKRKAASAIQDVWRKRDAKRQEAAKAIQKAFRDKKEKRALNRTKVAASKIQSAWRGYQIRTKAPDSVKKANKRIRAAKVRAKADPSRTLASKCKEAVETVKRNTNVEQTFLALASLEMGTMYSQRCCEDIVTSEALVPLMRVMARCNRSTEHQAAFRRGLCILNNLCKYNGLTIRVFRAKDCLETLSERLQYYRDCPILFSGIITVFEAMLKIQSNRVELTENVPVIKQWNALWSLLARKVDTERRYINKLEADKASDMSARRATEKAFLASHQLIELGDLFNQLAMSPTDYATYAHTFMNPESEDGSTKKKKKKKSKPEPEPAYEDWRYEASGWKPKNMIAKEKLSQLRTTALPIDAGAPLQRSSSYLPPAERKRLGALSNDFDAEKFERRTNIRLMSDYRNKAPKIRSGSMAPVKEKKETGQSSKIPRKINRSFSVAPEPNSRYPRSIKKAAK